MAVRRASCHRPTALVRHSGAEASAITLKRTGHFRWWRWAPTPPLGFTSRFDVRRSVFDVLFMRFLLPFFALLAATSLHAELSPEQKAKLPPPAARAVDFASDIQPLFEAACVKCHAKGKDKGGFSLETRAAFLKGGDTGPGAVPGRSEESYVVELVAGLNPDSVMPKKGTKWTPAQIGLLRAWIDQGAHWPEGITFAKPVPNNLHPHAVALPETSAAPNAIDRLLAPYFAEKKMTPSAPVADGVFARRVYLDLIGLLPTPAQLDAFLADTALDKRDRLVRALLDDRRNYADHWLTFWSDLLRNDYKGTGFIDGGRKQISNWLYQALLLNLPYDRFVAQLVAPGVESEGFTRGIIWRGNVNASMLPPMQAAQNVSQVFLGVNLKCASCHDSFINDWSLADAYGMAAVFSDAPLELVHCDKPTGKTAAIRFLYPEIGALDPSAPRAERMARLAEIVTSREDGRLSRTLVNRLWARLFGRGLVEPLDDMDRPAWRRELLDWLAEDFVAHGYDVKRVLATICTSRAYAMPAVEGPRENEEYIFGGPLTRRLSAEQFRDAISALTGEWARLPSSFEFDFVGGGLIPEVKMPAWIWTDEPIEAGPQRDAIRAARAKFADTAKKLGDAQSLTPDAARAALTEATALANAAQEQLKAAAQSKSAARHRVIFRKLVKLPEPPAEAFAVALGTQGYQVFVNGQEAKSRERDGFRNGRIALMNLQPLLVAGDNVITFEISSHTEKSMNDIERQKYPASTNHINATSGVAFYARCVFPAAQAEPIQISTDETWRVQRNPEGAWSTPAFSDALWAAAKPLPPDTNPIDEGPGLDPISRRDFANMPVIFRPEQLRAAVSMVANTAPIRAPLLSADPLQVALDRPNREVVVPVRATAATTMQALELTNGKTLDGLIRRAAPKLAADAANHRDAWLTATFRHALARDPTGSERAACADLLGEAPSTESVADFLWALANLPEFQLVN
jgi:mono/diheme cytochrome c family protein